MMIPPDCADLDVTDPGFGELACEERSRDRQFVFPVPIFVSGA
jgi:hypothetical protein